ncbi:hypothetical protein K7432_010058 [Basidiobolus ranarum]|uniref:DUF962 domain-containing protein n=1 Tax=Basidiobolus ranarum TaxID=34480 RepID=A0ABR2WPH2_9FUNG
MKLVVNSTYTPQPYSAPYTSFDRFYPFYLGEHSNIVCRRLHITGTGLVILVALAAIIKGDPKYLFACLLVGYTPAWIGHYFFEKNRPATFKHPFYSLLGDFKLFSEVLSGRRSF